MALVTSAVKKKPVLKSRIISNQLIQPTKRPATVKPPSAGRAPAVPKQPTPVAPTPIATPALSVAPISMPSSTANRVDARQQYGLAMGDVNRQLQDLARQFGGANSVQQYGYGVSGNFANPAEEARALGTDSATTLSVTPNDPNSVVATIARNLSNQQKFVDQSHEGDNTFFSGMRLTDQDKAVGDADRARTQAQNDYQTAIANLVSQLTGARLNRNSAISGANAADDEATARAIAEAQAQAAARVPPPPAAPAIPRSTPASQVAAMIAARKKNPLGVWGRY